MDVNNIILVNLVLCLWALYYIGICFQVFAIFCNLISHVTEKELDLRYEIYFIHRFIRQINSFEKNILFPKELNSIIISLMLYLPTIVKYSIWKNQVIHPKLFGIDII